MKKIITLLLCLFTTLCVCTSCKKDENTIVIGTMMIPGQKILEHIKPEFEKK